jgi:hypothetical protein
MQKFLVVLQYACIAFGLYLIYSVGMSLYTQQFELMALSHWMLLQYTLNHIRLCLKLLKRKQQR